MTFSLGFVELPLGSRRPPPWAAWRLLLGPSTPGQAWCRAEAGSLQVAGPAGGPHGHLLAAVQLLLAVAGLLQLSGPAGGPRGRLPASLQLFLLPLLNDFLALSGHMSHMASKALSPSLQGGKVGTVV